MFVGDTPRQLLILSGVAIPEWRSGGDLDRQEVVIRLGVTTTAQYNWTATVSLAAISNDDTDFLFALDSTSMDTDQDGTLRLHVAIAAQGDPADLLRFNALRTMIRVPGGEKLIMSGNDRYLEPFVRTAP